jgi:hypothetical protein
VVTLAGFGAWFWNAHDTLAILDAWSQHIPPDHVHVITMPRNGPADLLWMRFASVLGIDHAGDLGELLPRPVTGRHAAGEPVDLHRWPAARQHDGPAGLAADQLLDTAVHAAAALAGRQFQQIHPAPAPRRRLGPPRQMARRLQWKVLNGARMRRLLRNASHRPAVRRLRVVIWCVLTRPHATTPGPGPGRREAYRPARDAR